MSPHARAPFGPVVAAAARRELVEPDGRVQAGLHHQCFKAGPHRLARIKAHRAVMRVLAIRRQIIEALAPGAVPQVRNRRLVRRILHADGFEVLQHGDRVVGPEAAQVEVALGRAGTVRIRQFHFVPRRQVARPALGRPRLVQRIQRTVFAFEPGDEAGPVGLRIRHERVADLVVEPDRDHGRMFAVALRQLLGQTDGVTAVIRVADVEHVALGRLHGRALRIHEVHARVFAMQPQGRRRAGDVHDYLDAVRLHGVDDAVEFLELELAVFGFEVIPGQVAHPDDVEPGLLHQGDVALDLVGCAVDGLVARPDEQLSRAGPAYGCRERKRDRTGQRGQGEGDLCNELHFWIF